MPFTDMEDSSDLRKVERAIGYRFNTPELLVTAITHSSFASENDVESYERLEFLGDAVLELATTQRIFELLDDAPEGRMTRIRASVVDEATLALVSTEHGLESSIRLGVGEDRNGGRDSATRHRPGTPSRVAHQRHVHAWWRVGSEGNRRCDRRNLGRARGRG